MADGNVVAKSAAYRSAEIKCHQADIEGLTTEQLYALHLCKHEMAAAVHRLYFKVKPEEADPLLMKHLQNLLIKNA
ncbi:MAG: hypothetical protein AAF950_04685 [Pseudomonadota bacterium]